MSDGSVCFARRFALLSPAAARLLETPTDAVGVLRADLERIRRRQPRLKQVQQRVQGSEARRTAARTAARKKLLSLPRYDGRERRDSTSSANT